MHWSWEPLQQQLRVPSGIRGLGTGNWDHCRLNLLWGGVVMGPSYPAEDSFWRVDGRYIPQMSTDMLGTETTRCNQGRVWEPQCMPWAELRAGTWQTDRESVALLEPNGLQALGLFLLTDISSLTDLHGLFYFRSWVTLLQSNRQNLRQLRSEFLSVVCPRTKKEMDLTPSKSQLSWSLGDSGEEPVW